MVYCKECLHLNVVTDDPYYRSKKIKIGKYAYTCTHPNNTATRQVGDSWYEKGQTYTVPIEQADKKNNKNDCPDYEAIVITPPEEDPQDKTKTK